MTRRQSRSRSSRRRSTSPRRHQKYHKRSPHSPRRSKHSRSPKRSHKYNKYDQEHQFPVPSKKSRYSQQPNKTLASGPLVFCGTPGVSLGQTPKTLPTQPTPLRTEKKTRRVSEEFQKFEWEEIEKDLDRAWYDEDAGAEDLFLGDQDKFQAIEEQIDQRSNLKNLKKMERSAENTKWELNRMLGSGVFKMNLNQDLDEVGDNSVMVNVHDIKPPFLDGKQVYTSQTNAITVVKDPKSDLALLAKKGSQVVKALREKNDRSKMRERFWELAGSKLGDLLKIQKTDEDPDLTLDQTDENYDYKKASQFSSSLLPSTPQSDFAKHLTIRQQREFLPIFGVKEELMALINDHKIVIIVGETGSGKTTQLTQYLYESGLGQNGLIGCTQPRRVAAVSVAKRVAEEMNVTLGSKVGYSIRFEDVCNKETKIKYMTDGVLLRESLQDPSLEQYAAVVMDEAHERSLHTDVLFGILLKVSQMRRDVKIIITSATMNAERFSEFFGGAPIYTIPGRTFPVEVNFAKAPVDDYVDQAVKQAVGIHINQPVGDILIFMTGQEDIESTCILLAEQLGKIQGVPQLQILPIYSQLPSDVQAKIFQKSDSRKCIVATNIAETSLTLDGVRYVIDTGFCKLKVYNPKIGMDALQVTPISQANSNQRAGRAGRTGPGQCFRLYTNEMFTGEMLENNVPEIQRTNLANVVLLLKNLQVDNLLDFDFMDPPSQDTILSSMYQLWIMGALDNLGNLTQTGQKMAEFPLDPNLSKMLLEAHRQGCTEEMLTIVSMLSVPSIFYRPRDRETEADAAREKLFVSESDHLTLLNVYNQWKSHDYSSEWCNKHYVHIKSLRKVREVRSQLKEILVKQNLDLVSCEENQDLVRKAICSGYFTNAAKIKSIGEYVNLRTGIPCRLHPSSSLFSLGYAPDYLVYHELVMTTKEYMQCVTAVDPYWLAEMGPMFFSIKENFGKSRQEKRDMEKNTKFIMEKDIEKAMQQQQQIRKQKQEVQEEQDEIRRLKSEHVAGPGSSVMKTPLRTPKIRY